jgi:hypothetical protein
VCAFKMADRWMQNALNVSIYPFDALEGRLQRDLCLTTSDQILSHSAFLILLRNKGPRGFDGARIPGHCMVVLASKTLALRVGEKKGLRQSKQT